MKKEIKNFEKIVSIILILLTIINLAIDALALTGMVNNDTTSSLYRLITSTPFSILLWTDMLLIFIVGLLYIKSVMETKKDILIKITFFIFSILTTPVVIVTVITLIERLFGITH